MPSTNEKNRIAEFTLQALRTKGIDTLKILEALEIPEYDNDDDPPEGATYFNTDANRLTRKDSDDPVEVTNLSAAGSGADSEATFITAESESSLPNNFKHSELTGTRLHPPRGHSNSAHTETYAVEGETQPPENHGNSAHTSTYAVDGDTQPPETHDNTAHSSDYIPGSERGAENGVAELNADQVLKNSQTPSLNATEVFTPQDSAGRLSLTESELDIGDIAIEQDTNDVYIHLGGDPSLEDNWSRFTVTESSVTSVFGRTGDVSASTGDYSYSQLDGSHGNEDHDSTYIEGVDAQDSGTSVDPTTTVINFNQNLSVTQTATGEVEVDASESGGGSTDGEIQAVARRTS